MVQNEPTEAPTETEAPETEDNDVEENEVEISEVEVKPTGPIKDLRESTGSKLFMLFFDCNMLLGLYYCFDLPGTLNT